MVTWQYTPGTFYSFIHNHSLFWHACFSFCLALFICGRSQIKTILDSCIAHFQLLVQEVAQQKMRISAGSSYASPIKSRSSSSSSGGGGSKSASMPSIATSEDGPAAGSTAAEGTSDLMSPVGSEPGSEGRVKRKKTQQEKDDFLNARMGLKIEDTTKGKAVVTKTVARDFFGREIKPKASLPTAVVAAEAGADKVAASHAAVSPRRSPRRSPRAKKFKKSGPVFIFKYQEGYSNAVRRTVRLEDLL